LRPSSALATKDKLPAQANAHGTLFRFTLTNNLSF